MVSCIDYCPQEMKMLINLSTYDLFWIIWSKNYSLHFGDWFFSVPLTFDLTRRGVYCLGSVCQSRLRTAVWHLVKSSKKIDEMHMMKNNALYPCVVTIHALSQSMPRHNPSVVTIHASSQSMRRHNPCVVTIHALSQSMRRHNPCVVTIHASSQSMRRHNPCVLTIHASSQYMRRQHPCVVTIHGCHNPCVVTIHVTDVKGFFHRKTKNYFWRFHKQRNHRPTLCKSISHLLPLEYFYGSRN